MHVATVASVPPQLPGMEKVAALIREADKDADKAWATGLGQLLDAMAASRVALLGSFVLTGEEKRRVKGMMALPCAKSKAY